MSERGACCGVSSARRASHRGTIPALLGGVIARTTGAEYDSTMAIEERITVTPGVRGGKPCVRGTRITAYDVLEYLAGGMTEQQIVEDFPSLTSEDIRAVLAFAAARERRLAAPPAA